jgi:hypothetical protein
VGVFRIGRPIGRRSMIKAGGDLIFITEDGFTPASALVLDRSQAEKSAISGQINQAVNDAVRSYSGLFGWEAFIYPAGRMLMFNIPQTSTTAHQYVFNTLTRAPCRFKGWNAQCWALVGNIPYFGGADGKVYRADIGTSDNGTAIFGDALQAFSYFGSPGQEKSFKRVRPLFQSNGDPAPALDLNVNFDIKAPTGVSTPSVVASAKWGISKWGIGSWGSASQIYRTWRSVRGYGRSASLRVRVSSTSARPSWVSTDWMYVPGGQR